MGRSVKIAIVGLGVRGRQWKRVIDDSEGSEVIAIVEPRGAVQGTVPTYSAISEVPLDVHADAIIVASPPQAHAEAVRWGLRAGVPVLCEKPLTESYAESLALARDAQASGGHLSVGMNFRYVPATQHLKRMVKNRTLGMLLFGDFTYITHRDGRHPELNDFPLSMLDPMLIEQSIHHLDLIRYVYDEPVRRLVASTWNPASSVYQGDSCVAAILELSGGSRVAYFGTWTAGSRRMEFRWRSDFEDGAVVQDDPFGDLGVSTREPGLWRTARPYDNSVEPFVAVGLKASIEFYDETSALLKNLEQLVLSGAADLPLVDDYMETLLLVEGVRQSTASAGWVDMEALKQAVKR